MIRTNFVTKKTILGACVFLILWMAYLGLVFWHVNPLILVDRIYHQSVMVGFIYFLLWLDERPEVNDRDTKEE